MSKKTPVETSGVFFDISRELSVQCHATGMGFRPAVRPGFGDCAVNCVAILVHGHHLGGGFAVRAGDAFRPRMRAVGVHYINCVISALAGAGGICPGCGVAVRGFGRGRAGVNRVGHSGGCTRAVNGCRPIAIAGDGFVPVRSFAVETRAAAVQGHGVSAPSSGAVHGRGPAADGGDARIFTRLAVDGLFKCAGHAMAVLIGA